MATKASTKTKAQLIDENDQLKSKLREYRDLAEQRDKEQSSNNQELNELAVGFIKQEGLYKIVKVGYNRESLKAAVLSIENASHLPETTHMSTFELRKFLEEEIMNKALD